MNIWPSGNKYEGYWNNNNKHAFGKFTYSDGASYEGEYHHDKRQGHGVLTWPDGYKYDGPFKDDKMHGIGYEHNTNGRIFKVEFCEDEFIREIVD